jgi:hypothetical protein
MNKKEFTEYDELRKFVEPLIAEQKWAIDVRQNTTTGIYMALWIEHKSVEREGGTKEPDEIWTTRTGDMICVQDMSETHVRDVLRMLLRNEREQRAMIDNLAQQMAAQVEAEETVPVAMPTNTVH